MPLIEDFISFFKRLPPIKKFLLAVSPFLISALIHLIFISYAGLVPWNFSRNKAKEMTTPIIMDVKKDENLGLHRQGDNEFKNGSLDSVKPKPRRPYLGLEVKVRPITPEVGALPVSKNLEQPGDKLDIIGLEGEGGLSGAPTDGVRGFSIGLGNSGGSFSQKIQAMREGGLDVVFVVDSTASMTSVLQQVKLKINNLASSLRRLVPNCRIGLVTYRDQGDQYVTKIHSLTYGNLLLWDFLTAINAEGGTDQREAVEEGLGVAVKGMKWNPNTMKFILLIGDAPPHEQNIAQAVSLVRKFRKEMGGTLSAIDTRVPQKMTKQMWETVILPGMTDPELDSYSYMTDPQSVMKDFKTFAEIGGGESARIIDAEKVVKNMLLLIFGNKWEAYLNDVMKNL
ncbi:MAG TPA: vWA domain-containing protein [Thermodesulfobacteriota bacterium]|nr:vWA domain-containing protein [Thermodesulfobacteriota bacterium]